MSKFPFAYCPAINDYVEPEDIIDMHINGNPIPRLQCPDDKCREDMPYTEIIAVCCDPQKPCINKNPYFRTGPTDKHSKNCRYNLYSESTDYIISHKDDYKMYAFNTNITKKLKSISDTSIIPDIYTTEYNPHAEYQAIEVDAQMRIRHGISHKRAYRLARCSTPHTTGSLSTIIRVAERLAAANEREKVNLSLPGRENANYKNAFFPVKKLKSHYKTSYILYGTASICRAENGFLCMYSHIINDYTPEYSKLCAMMPLPLNLCRPSLLRSLEYHAKHETKCCIYALSTHSLKENISHLGDKKSFVVIEPIIRGSVVIKKCCLNEFEKSNFLTNGTENL